MESPETFMDDFYNFHVKDGVTVERYISDEVKQMASSHWLNFPPSHPFIADFIAIFFALLSICNISANGFIIFLFLKESSLRTPSNMFILNLAISDMLMLITNGVPIALSPFFGNYWSYGSLYCTLYGFAGGVSGIVSIWTMVFIGYDRYKSITNKYKTPSFTSKQAMFALIFIWVYPTLIMLPPALGIWSRYALEGLLLTCSFEYCVDTVDNATYVVFLTFTSFVVPMMHIIYFYYFIVKTVKKFFSALRSSDNKYMAFAFSEKIATESKINRLAVTSVLLWLLAWTPYALVVLIGQFGPRYLLTPLASQIPSMCTKTCTVFNCVTFGFSHPHVQKAAKKCFNLDNDNKNKLTDATTYVMKM